MNSHSKADSPDTSREYMCTTTAIRRGHIGDNKSLNTCKKVKGLEKIWTEETQIPELGKCRLSQRPTKKRSKTSYGLKGN